jgi:membrane protein
VLTTLGGTDAGSFGPALKIAVLAASVLVNAVAFIIVFQLATARPLRISQVAPGAIIAAVFWQLLQSIGVIYVNHVVRQASATNGVFAIVLGLLAFLYLTAIVIVLCIEVDVVRVDSLYPRSLMTPFTDNVALTQGDRDAYTGQATAQRSKGFEEVHVHFDQTQGDDGLSR